MRSKYQRETVSSRQSALQRLTQERFLLTDSPDTYEKRIRPLLLGVADGDAQTVGFLKNHLSGDLYTWMRAVNPAGINAFFTNLKDMWLEHAPNLNGGQNYQNNSSAEIEKLNSQIASLQAQLAQPAQVHSQSNEALDKLYVLAERLGMPSGTPKDSMFLDKYITDELIKRLGVIETHLAELSVRGTRTESSQHRYLESSDHSNEGLEERLGQIETHLAKLTRKDTRGTKSSQRQRSEFSTFNNKGLEKRLGRIEILLAKLTKDSKSKSARVHMATAGELSDPIFSDDD